MRGHSIVVLHAGAPTGEKDSLGAPVRGADLRISSSGWTFEPLDSSEDAGTIVTRARLYRREETPIEIRPIDRIETGDGRVWSVDGDPLIYKAGPARLVVNLVRRG